MKKSNKLVIFAIVLLVGVVAIMAFLNRDNAAKKQTLIDNAEFIVMENGQEVAKFTMPQISEMGETTFKANYKTNGKPPIEYEYTGVLLKTIVEKAGVSLEGKTMATVMAVDGYASVVEMKKLNQEGNVYLAYKREGKLIGTKQSGGKGPYQMIISKDQFSQHWCKYAVSVDIK
ncbi:hypothetical protein IMX26_00755 [Clostridium sp. 'deep sea']|uniref:hypothetical protein n=1 Tax=Clostridium sp. 'deep sea' TaxID=2779445 RepID=UPI0018967E51|nr:hypothetical protein [Clostridium sp. 'deep sea']QOR35405.1 hypothetical protein IMX26_00755 [Clostridium sp. 'deep sea']